MCVRKITGQSSDYLYSLYILWEKLLQVLKAFKFCVSFQRCGLVTKSCLTLVTPMDCSPPGSCVHGIFQARILEWVAISFSRGSSWPRNQTRFSCRQTPALQIGSLQPEPVREVKSPRLYGSHKALSNYITDYIHFHISEYSYVFCKFFVWFLPYNVGPLYQQIICILILLYSCMWHTLQTAGIQ